MDARSYMVGYIKAFIDAEGCVSKQKITSPVITVSNTQRPLLRRVQLYLKALDIESKLYGPYGTGKRSKPIYRLKIWRRQSILNYYDIVGFYHPDKYARLITAVNYWKRKEFN